MKSEVVISNKVNIKLVISLLIKRRRGTSGCFLDSYMGNEMSL